MAALLTFFSSRLGIAAVGAALLGLTFWAWRDAEAEADRYQLAAEAEAANHQQTKDAYAAAQLEAQRLEKQRIANVKAEQEDITDAVETDYRRRIADARADYERLRAEQARARLASAARGQPVPHIPDPAGGADGTAEEDGFPLSDRLIATEQAIQLEALQDWVRRQSQVDVNPVAEPLQPSR